MRNALLWLAGGLCAGGGILLALLGGFGVPGGDTAEVFSTQGFNGIDNIQISGQGMLAVALFVVGVAALALASASAWKETGGY